MSNRKISQLLDKSISDYLNLIESYQYGDYPINYSLIFEEIMFLKYLGIDCMKESTMNSIIEYFLNNDYKTTDFKRV